MQYNDVKNMLGPCTQALVYEGMADSKYANAKDYVSAGGLKEYLTDPELALRVRVLKTSEKPEFGATAMSNMRIGKAVHCYGLEGEEVFKAKFPSYTITPSKRGEAWEKFKEENKEAFREDNILNVKEEIAVNDLGPKLKKGLEAKITSFQTRGWEVLKACPEISMFATYASGISLKIRIDALFILRINGLLFFAVEDVKTTAKSITDFDALAYDIDSFKYHLQAVVYLMVAQDALSNPANLRQLGVEPGTDDYLNIGGQFNFLWLSKLSKTCGFQEAFLNYGQVEDGSWDNWALAAFATSLVHLNNVLAKGETVLNQAAEANNKEVLDEVATFVQAPPSGRMRWSHGKFVDIANDNRINQMQFRLTEASLRGNIKQIFPPEFVMPEPPEIEQVKRKPKKKKKAPPPPPKEVKKKEEMKVVKEEVGGEIKEDVLYNKEESDLGGFAILTKDNLNEHNKADLKEHPVINSGLLSYIDWDKNVKTIKAAIKRDLKRLGKGLDQEQIINDFLKGEKNEQ